ncbi:DNA cytosine methyltransferase [bacterium]|nr:MAG: DNA cytosine methyltransferase [bacterium]
MRDAAHSLIAVSLFSGAGGLDLGVEQCGVHVAAALERDPVACKTLKRNFAEKREHPTKIIQGDIEEISVSELRTAAGLSRGDVDLVIGGPPCTPFSKSGYWIEYKRAGLDPDRFLLEHYVRFVKELRPRAFIMENVHALAYKNHNRKSLDTLRSALGELGYHINERVLVAAEYGVPQVRQRLFIIGAKARMPVFPKATHSGTYETKRQFDGDLKPFVTCAQAFRGLPDIPESGEAVGGLYGHLLPEIPTGDNYLFFTRERGYPKPKFKWRSRYWTFLLKLHPERPSTTIQAQPGPYIGPFHWDNRRLRVPELKALQTFPHSFVFEGNRRAVQVQIGNAVPPQLARLVGDSLIASALDEPGKEKSA